jgi:hypothetical protein
MNTLPAPVTHHQPPVDKLPTREAHWEGKGQQNISASFILHGTQEHIDQTIIDLGQAVNATHPARSSMVGRPNIQINTNGKFSTY